MTKMTTGTSPDEKVGSLEDSLTTVKPSNAEEVDDGNDTSREGAGDADDDGEKRAGRRCKAHREERAGIFNGSQIGQRDAGARD